MAASSTRDARAVRSNEALRAALLRLIERKPLDQVTVREIAAEAGVHYATFFRHHQTKEALLDHVAAEQIDRLVKLTLPALEQDAGTAVAALLREVDAHRSLWTTLLTGGAAAAMRAELLRIARTMALSQAPEDAWLPTELAVNCSVSLVFETLAWWLARPGELAIGDIADKLHHLLLAVQGRAL